MTTTEKASVRAAFDPGELSYLVNKTARTYMNGLAPHLAPLRWMYDYARDGSHDMRLAAIIKGDDANAVAAQWGAALGLGRPIYRHSGTRHWVGRTADGTQVNIWYIADQQAWDAANGRTPAPSAASTEPTL
ncbi:hypothetical protein [Nocardia sp. N2S4-5]|uniref:hypothetical protein n=1 Tax=Nocardia sp. N2S4-5 TaxID=3351565 RepID=UPI0037D98D30